MQIKSIVGKLQEKFLRPNPPHRHRVHSLPPYSPPPLLPTNIKWKSLLNGCLAIPHCLKSGRGASSCILSTYSMLPRFLTYVFSYQPSYLLIFLSALALAQRIYELPPIQLQPLWHLTKAVPTQLSTHNRSCILTTTHLTR